MADAPKVPKRLEARKEPTQSRSTATVDALLEAAAQLLVAQGYEALNTNEIAERAGVAVGSLYQYFPNKDAILAALCRRQAEREAAWVLREMAEYRGQSAADAIEHVVRAVFAFRRAESPLQGALLAQLHHLGRFPELADRVREAMVGLHPWFEAHRGEFPGRDPELVLHILVNAIHAQTHDGVLGYDPRFEMADYEAEVIRLARSYLGG